MARLIRSRLFLAALALCLTLGAIGVWVLLHPGSLWLQPWRAERSSHSPHVVFGPYPLEADFVALKNGGVATIVSLLDPDLPYERILLAQERKRADRHGIRLLNFPMASILGQSFGTDYVANSRAAADAALRSRGVVYIHCYLGLHRAKYVQQFLAASGTSSRYAGSVGRERPQDVQSLDRANIAFLQGRYEDTLRELTAIDRPAYPALLLQSWAQYRLGDLDSASRGFAEVARTHPDNRDALAGLGYSALQRGDLAGAERHFQFALSQHPDDVAAVEGLGYVRFRQGRNDEAGALLQRVVDRVPGNTDARDVLRKVQAAIAADASATNAPGAMGERDLQP